MQPATEAAAIEVDGSPRVDLTGRKFGRLTVIGFAGRRKTGKSVAMMWTCLCECGAARPVAYPALIQGRATQCKKCWKASHHWRTHGMSSHPLYSTWSQMIDRCTNKKCPGFKNYGGRGIQVCDRWLASFEFFLEDMGEKPSSEHSIDRIDNNGNYEPGNCRWATQTEQCRNTRWARQITFNGETLTITEWAERLGITRERLRQRLQTRSAEEALSCRKGQVPDRLKEVSKGRPRIDDKDEFIGRLDWMPDDWFDGQVRRIDRGVDFAPKPSDVAGYIRDRAARDGMKATTRIIDDTILFKVEKQTA